jgi:hypothetical protein
MKQCISHTVTVYDPSVCEENKYIKELHALSPYSTVYSWHKCETGVLNVISKSTGIIQVKIFCSNPIRPSHSDTFSVIFSTVCPLFPLYLQEKVRAGQLPAH